MSPEEFIGGLLYNTNPIFFDEFSVHNEKHKGLLKEALEAFFVKHPNKQEQKNITKVLRDKMHKHIFHDLL